MCHIISKKVGQIISKTTGDTPTVVTGAASVSSRATPASSPGVYTIVATQGTLAAANYTFVFLNGDLTVIPATPGVGPTPPVTLNPSLNPAPSDSPVTLTVTVPAGATGTVSFYDGTTLLGTAPVTGNTASLTISTLGVGTHAISAVYSGDANFTTVTTKLSLVIVSAPDFTVASSTGRQLIPPGASASFTIVVSSMNAPFANSVTMSATNLPPGATYTFTPYSSHAGSSRSDHDLYRQRSKAEQHGFTQSSSGTHCLRTAPITVCLVEATSQKSAAAAGVDAGGVGLFWRRVRMRRRRLFLANRTDLHNHRDWYERECDSQHNRNPDSRIGGAMNGCIRIFVNVLLLSLTLTAMAQKKPANTLDMSTLVYQPRPDYCRREEVRLRHSPAGSAKTPRAQPDGKVLVTDGYWNAMISTKHWSGRRRVPSPAMWPARCASFFSTRLQNKNPAKASKQPGHCDFGICTVLTMG